MIGQILRSSCFVLTGLAFVRVGAGAVPATRPATVPTTLPAPASRPAAHSGRPQAGADDLTHLSLEDLMNIEVTSVSKKKQSISDAPAAVSVISADDISRSGFSTIPDLLRLAPGTDVARINSYTYSVSVRGQNDEFANKLLVLQDGRSLYTPLFNGVLWDTVDYTLEDLDRIEVIKGPGATLWGANAVNGVINITSKDARDTQGWLITTRGSNDESNFGARYGGQLSDDTWYRAYLKTKYDADLEQADGDPAGDHWYSLRGGFRIDKHPSAADTYTLQGDIDGNRMHADEQLPISTYPFMNVQSIGRTDATGNVLTRWTHQSGEDSDFTLQLYYDYLKVDEHAQDYAQDTYDLDFHDRFKFGKSNEVVWGAGYRLVHSDIVGTPEFSGDPATRNDSVYSAFIQDTVTLDPDKWFVTLGSKLEHNDYTGFEYEPSARVLWKINKQSSAWGAVSRSVATPSRLETDTHVMSFSGPAQIELYGNPNQDSEELLAYEVGYRIEPVKDLSFDISAFYNKYDRLRSSRGETPPAGIPPIILGTWDNNIAGQTYGGEVAAQWRVTERWRLEGSYSLLEARFGSDNPSDATNVAENSASSPRNQAQIHSYWDVTQTVQVNANAFYVGRVSEFNIPSYISTDLNLKWKPTDTLELTLGILNLFDNRHPEFGATGGQGVTAETPRTFYGEMSYKF